MSIIDPRDFYDGGPPAESEPFELLPPLPPRWNVHPDGAENLRRALGLPAPPVGDPVAEFGDPEAKW